MKQLRVREADVAWDKFHSRSLPGAVMLIELANDILSKFAIYADNVTRSNDSTVRLSNSILQLPVLPDEKWRMPCGDLRREKGA
jgi:hypothetical protein